MQVLLHAKSNNALRAVIARVPLSCRHYLLLFELFIVLFVHGPFGCLFLHYTRHCFYFCFLINIVRKPLASTNILCVFGTGAYRACFYFQLFSFKLRKFSYEKFFQWYAVAACASALHASATFLRFEYRKGKTFYARWNSLRAAKGT
jgi:hypothetical protein